MANKFNATKYTVHWVIEQVSDEPSFPIRHIKHVGRSFLVVLPNLTNVYNAGNYYECYRKSKNYCKYDKQDLMPCEGSSSKDCHDEAIDGSSNAYHYKYHGSHGYKDTSDVSNPISNCFPGRFSELEYPGKYHPDTPQGEYQDTTYDSPE